MRPDTKIKLAELSELSIGQLAAKYEKLFGEKCRSRNRRYVYRRVAWKMQADDEGGLSERAILRATVIAGESLLRVTPPNARKSKKEVPASIPPDWDQRIPPPGQVIERHDKGKLLIVMVMIVLVVVVPSDCVPCANWLSEMCVVICEVCVVVLLCVRGAWI